MEPPRGHFSPDRDEGYPSPYISAALCALSFALSRNAGYFVAVRTRFLLFAPHIWILLYQPNLGQH